MLTEEEIQKYEETARALVRNYWPESGGRMLYLLTAYRELQADNAALRSQFATERAKVELMDRQIAGLVEHQHKMRLEEFYGIECD